MNRFDRERSSVFLICHRVRKVNTKKFTGDLVWNFVSFGIVGLSGLLINLTIGRFYLVEDLGTFNQVFAFYIVGAQFATLGLQYSALKFSSEESDLARLRKISSSAILAALMLAIPVSVFLFLSRDWIGELFESPELGLGLAFAAPATGLFALNKVMIAVLNGRRYMKLFAVFQASRFLVLFVSVLLSAIAGLPGYYLPAAMLVSELVLVVGLVIAIGHLVGFKSQGIGSMVLEHLKFGSKGFMGGAMTELNSRVDVLMLGLFTTDALVGMYSMAAMISEGIAQFAVVVRNNVNPLITRLYIAMDVVALSRLIRSTRNYTYGGMAIVLLLVGMLYPFILEILIGSGAYFDSWLVFLVLAAGLLLSAGYLPVDMILIQTGSPGWHTVLRSFTLVSNILLNASLIPVYGLLGAAVGTSISYVLSIMLLRTLCRRLLGPDVM